MIDAPGETIDPWTLYWQADRLDSAEAVRPDSGEECIRGAWAEFAAALDDGAGVLDLATGNGSVPAALLGAKSDLRIHGVDRADIDPLRFLQSPGPLNSVTFRGGMDICSLPFADASFDAITSQFGIEYAPLDRAVAEAARVLRAGGSMQLLLHRAASEIVAPAAARQAEMSALLASGGVLPRLRAYVAGELELQTLEAAGQHHRESGSASTKGITGQIFAGVNQAIEHMQKGDRRSAVQLCETMILRLGADRDRLRALRAAALDAAGFDVLLSMLETAGIDTVSSGELRVEGHGEFVIGWLYRGRKRQLESSP